MTLTARNTRCCHIFPCTKCLPCYPFKPSFFTEGKGLCHTFIYTPHMVTCDEVIHCFTHEDDFLKVFYDHLNNQRKSNITYKQLSNEELC